MSRPLQFKERCSLTHLGVVGSSRCGDRGSSNMLKLNCTGDSNNEQHKCEVYTHWGQFQGYIAHTHTYTQTHTHIHMHTHTHTIHGQTTLQLHGDESLTTVYKRINFFFWPILPSSEKKFWIHYIFSAIIYR